MQFDSVKSMMRNLPPNGTAGLERQSVSCIRRLPRPPASTIPKVLRVISLFLTTLSSPSGLVARPRCRLALELDSWRILRCGYNQHDSKNLFEYITMPALACAALLEAREHDPFSVLGLHAEGAGWRLRVFRPQAKAVAVALANGEWATLSRRSGSDLFEWHGAAAFPAPASASGHRTPSGFRWSAISTAGTAACIRWLPWAPPACGSCSSPALPPDSLYKYEIRNRHSGAVR
jgi:hypothetical protein